MLKQVQECTLGGYKHASADGFCYSSMLKANRSSPPEETAGRVCFLVVCLVHAEHRRYSGGASDRADCGVWRVHL